MNPELAQLRETISKRSDEDLLRMVNTDSAQYRQEALDYARDELAKRGVSLGSSIDTTEAPEGEPPPKYVGVGGWLLLLCVGLTILSPLATLGNIGNSLDTVKRFSAQFPGLATVTYVDFALSIAVMLFGIYAGAALWGVSKGAVKTAKTYFLVRLAYAAVAFVLPFLAGLPAQYNDALLQTGITGIVQAVIPFAVWYTYLVKSKRVKATYGDEAPPTAD